MSGNGLALINIYEFLHPLYIYFQDESWVGSEISENDKKIIQKKQYLRQKWFCSKATIAKLNYEIIKMSFPSMQPKWLTLFSIQGS